MKEELIKEECESTGCAPEVVPNFPLWIINYKVVGPQQYAGFAIVKAPDCHIAERIFLSKTAHNGRLDNVKIMELKEVYTLPCPDLLAEEYLPMIPPKLPSKRQIGKKK